MSSATAAWPAPARRAFRALVALRGQTGLSQADVQNDFLRARRRQAAARLARQVCHRPASAARLMLLDEVVGALGYRGERRLGLQTIPLATIVGTVEPRRDFDRRFRPTTNRIRERWNGSRWPSAAASPCRPSRFTRSAACTSSKTGTTGSPSPPPPTRTRSTPTSPKSSRRAAQNHLDHVTPVHQGKAGARVLLQINKSWA
jgi:hypothetical protein